jgi:hypothetical protein
MAETAVYQFTWWDLHAGKDIVSPRFATLEAIARCNGKPIEASRLLVDSQQVDRNGFHFIPVVDRH